MFIVQCSFFLYLCSRKNAVIAQLAERWLPKPKVAGSNPVYRSIPFLLGPVA